MSVIKGDFKEKSVSEVAREELLKEEFEKNKLVIKQKVKQLIDAEKVVANLKREIADLEEFFNQDKS